MIGYYLLAKSTLRVADGFEVEINLMAAHARLPSVDKVIHSAALKVIVDRYGLNW
jgi:hypothetical protein